jgi:hypothetical protein
MELIIVDTAQIQPYVFGSNRLRENVGGSHLVAMATGDWALQATQETAPNNNISADNSLDPTKGIESDTDLQAEVIYTGGGNFVALFRDENEEAGKFIRRLSEKVLTDAPGLQLVITQESFNWGSDLLSDKVKEAFKKLARKKRTRTLSAPLLGLGVTAMCQSTAMPAVEMVKGIGEEPGRPASAEIIAKLKVATKSGPHPSEADERLHRMVPLKGDFDYPAQFEHLGGTKGEHSYIAVVHADGDGMGSRIIKIGEKYPTQKENRDYINAIREFSIAVEKAAQAALRVTLDKLTAKIERDNGRKVIVHRNEGRVLARIELCWDDKGHTWQLPFRPIVFGGDDLTFVCDGRLGLSFATEYMRQFTDKTKDLPDKKGSLTASAGIAIVKSHYPFARAYSLAEDLSKSAKGYRKKTDGGDACLDWHFARSGLSGEIKEIRKREYKATWSKNGVQVEGSLTLCPLTLEENKVEAQRSWNVVRNAIDVFQSEGWSERRNKLKTLRDALRGGPAEADWFLKKFGLAGTLPEIEGYSQFAQTGWWDKWCGYFDATELSDWFVPL